MEVARTPVTNGVAAALDELAAETVIMALLLVPFQVAVRMIHPVGKLCAVAGKTAETAPDGTVMLAGTLKAGLLAESPTVIAPAAFERVTVQMLLPPTFKAVGAQVSDTNVGVDHNAKVAV
jgi:hypothetical protein